MSIWCKDGKHYYDLQCSRIFWRTVYIQIDSEDQLEETTHKYHGVGSDGAKVLNVAPSSGLIHLGGDVIIALAAKFRNLRKLCLAKFW